MVNQKQPYGRIGGDGTRTEGTDEGDDNEIGRTVVVRTKNGASSPSPPPSLPAVSADISFDRYQLRGIPQLSMCSAITTTTPITVEFLE